MTNRSIKILLFLCFLGALPAFATTCGTVLTSNLVLQNNLTCHGIGLQIAADNVTLDLNGHTITCTDPAGFFGSCQQDGDFQNLTGILVSNVKNITIKGPGTVNGFRRGIFLLGVGSAVVTGIDVTGPAMPSIASPIHRGSAAGIVVSFSPSYIPAGQPVPVCPSSLIQIVNNNVHNQVQGIFLGGSRCVLVSGNNAHENNGGLQASGILLTGSSRNIVALNRVQKNGSGAASDAGIGLWFNDSTLNSVESNTVSANCGDGVAAFTAASSVFFNNVSLQNGDPLVDGRHLCPVPAVPVYDVANRFGTGITYANNVCKTQNASVPAGTCTAP